MVRPTVKRLRKFSGPWEAAERYEPNGKIQIAPYNNGLLTGEEWSMQPGVSGYLHNLLVRSANLVSRTGDYF
jgi:hypothetical protein